MKSRLGILLALCLLISISSVAWKSKTSAKKLGPESPPATEPAEAMPETSPETTASPEVSPPETTASPAVSEPETAASPETHPAAAEGEKSPPPSGQRKGIPYASGPDCVAKPEGPVVGYSLLLEFSSGDGEVCGVSLEIRNVKQRTVFSSKVASSWIYIDLPPGGYEVKAKKSGLEKSFSTQTTAGKLQKGRVFLSVP